MQGLAGILKVAPEHQKAVQPAVELIKAQVMEIEELRGALMHVHAELSSIVDGLQDEELEVIKAYGFQPEVPPRLHGPWREQLP